MAVGGVAVGVGAVAAIARACRVRPASRRSESVADGDEEGVETEASVNEDAAEAGEIEGNEAETGAERGGDRDGDRGGRRRRRGRRGGRRRAEGEFGEAQGAEGGEDAGSTRPRLVRPRVASPSRPRLHRLSRP